MTLQRVKTEEGSASVELILIAPVFVFIAFVCMQFAVLLFAELSLLATARDVTRWITVNPHTLDSTAIAAVKTRLPSDVDPSNLSISVAPTCTALTQGKCPNRSVGSDLAVTVSYDISSLYFLPQRFSLGSGLVIQLPASLPPYTMHMEVEPSS